MLIEKTVGYLIVPLLLLFIQLQCTVTLEFSVPVTLLGTEKIAVNKTEKTPTVILLG